MKNQLVIYNSMLQDFIYKLFSENIKLANIWQSSSQHKMPQNSGIFYIYL